MRGMTCGAGAGRRLLVAMAAMLFVGAACGSYHSDREFRNANAELLRAGGGPGAGQPAQPVASGPTESAATESSSEAPAASTASPAPGGSAVAPGDAAAASGSVPTGAGSSAGPSGSAPSEKRSSAAPRTGAQGNAGPQGGKPAPGASTTPTGPAVPVPQGGTKSEIRLGSVGTDSGPAGIPFVGLRDGARAWVADVNARGGLNGHPVRLVLADDGGDPSKAQEIVKRMVEVDKVQAFYATRGFLTEPSYISYLEQRQIPVIVTCACNPAAGPSPMTFDPYINAGGGKGGVWMHVGPVITQTDKRKIALLYCREAPVCVQIRDAFQKMAKQLGLTIVYEGQNSIAQPDYTAEVIAARNSGAEAVVSVNDNYTNIRILRSIKRQGWNVVFSSQFSNHDDRLPKDGGADLEGMLMPGAVALYDTSPKMADYRAAMERWVPGGVRSDFGAGSWLGGKLLEKMASRFGDTVTTNDILQGLYSFRGETLDGRIAPTTYPPDKPHDAVNRCIIPLTLKGGKYIPKNGDEFFCEPGWQPS